MKVERDDCALLSCRACLATDCDKYLSLFESYRSLAVYQHVNLVAEINITEGDGLPDKICKVCLADLETVLSFKERCKRSNSYLLNKLLNTETESKQDIKKELSDKHLEYFIVISGDNIDNDSDCNEKLVKTNHLDFKQQKDMFDIKKYDVKGEVQCDDCKQYFKSKCKLRVHWKAMHKPKTFFCDVCKRKFKSIKPYQKHINSETPCIDRKNVRVVGEGQTRIFHCKKCSYKTKTLRHLNIHLVRHTGQRPYKCEICSKTYTQWSSLIGHRETAHKIFKVEVTCQFCGKYVCGRNRVYTHMKQHSEERFQCDICKKVYKSKRNLVVHLSRHGSKNYTCEQCGVSFYTNAEISNHRSKVHMKKKIFKCKICNYASTKNTTVVSHQSKHTDSNHCCLSCGKFFDSQSRLQCHMNIHESKLKVYSCPLCCKSYTKKNSINHHLRRKHSPKIVPKDSNINDIKLESIFCLDVSEHSIKKTNKP